MRHRLGVRSRRVAYRRNGVGCKMGETRLLRAAQEALVCKLIMDKTIRLAVAWFKRARVNIDDHVELGGH